MSVVASAGALLLALQAAVIPSGSRPRVVVVPPAPRDTAQQILTRRLMHALRSHAATSPDLELLAAESARRARPVVYRGRSLTPPAAAQYLCLGAVTRARGDSVTVRVTIIDAASLDALVHVSRTVAREAAGGALAEIAGLAWRTFVERRAERRARGRR